MTKRWRLGHQSLPAGGRAKQVAFNAMPRRRGDFVVVARKFRNQFHQARCIPALRAPDADIGTVCRDRVAFHRSNSCVLCHEERSWMKKAARGGLGDGTNASGRSYVERDQ